MNSKKTKHILALVESLDVNDSSGTKGRVALLQNMVAAGFEVTALHYTQKEITLPGIKTVIVKEGRSRFYFLSRLQRYFYKWFGYNLGDGYEKRSGFSFNWKGAEVAFAKAIQNYNPEDYDMIWTLGKGTNFRPHAGVLKSPKWHAKWYAYVHDPYPQQLYPRPYNFVPLGYKKKRFFFAEVTQKAHKVVFPSLLLKDWMQSYFAAISGKSLIIPHQISEAQLKDIALPSYFKKEIFTVLHGGNLLDLRDPAPVVCAFKQFLKNTPEAQAQAQLLFLGKPGVFSTYLEQQQKEMPQLYYSKAYVPFEHVFSMQRSTSVNVILEAKGEISPFLPGKFAHCVAANKPILLVGPYYSECKRLLGDAYPYSFEFEEVALMAQAFSDLYNAWRKKERHFLDRPDLEQYLSVDYLSNVLT